MSRRPLLATVLLSAAVLSACGGGSSEPAAAPASSTTTVAPSPTPTEISREDAAAQYLELVAPYNEANARFKAVADGPWDQSAFTDAASKLADANQAFVEGLVTSEWPANAQGTVDELAAASAGGTSLMRQMAQVQSVEDVAALVLSAPKPSSDAPAQLLRVKLGLDEVPVTTPTPSSTAVA